MEYDAQIALDELEQQEFIGAFDKRTIIELSGDVIKEIAEYTELEVTDVEKLAELQIV